MSRRSNSPFTKFNQEIQAVKHAMTRSTMVENHNKLPDENKSHNNIQTSVHNSIMIQNQEDNNKRELHKYST